MSKICGNNDSQPHFLSVPFKYWAVAAPRLEPPRRIREKRMRLCQGAGKGRCHCKPHLDIHGHQMSFRHDPNYFTKGTNSGKRESTPLSLVNKTLVRRQLHFHPASVSLAMEHGGECNAFYVIYAPNWFPQTGKKSWRRDKAALS